MVFLLFLFIVVLLAIGLFSGWHQRSFRRFVIVDHDRSWPLILCSLLATMIGGSATFGIADTAYELGFPAIWWLGAGTIGLVLQGVFVSAKVRDLKVQTLGEAAELLVGRGAGLGVSWVIALSWPGIIAGQFIALGKIMSFLTGQADAGLFILIAALVVIAFTAFGGQLGVMRTDTVFLFLFMVGIVAAFCLLCLGMPRNLDLGATVVFFHEGFSFFDLIYILFIVGGTYFLGPDVLSRSMTAKNGRHAKTASLLGAAVLLLFNVMMVSVALWCRANVADLGGFDPLVYLMTFVLPPYATVLLALGLTAALLSSASTCLITVAATIQRDVLRREKVAETRLLIVVIGIAAVVLAWFNSDIIAVLTAAYSVYAPGIVMPLFIALMVKDKGAIDRRWWFIGVAVGGICGLIGSIGQWHLLPLLGMAASAGFALRGCRRGK